MEFLNSVEFWMALAGILPVITLFVPPPWQPILRVIGMVIESIRAAKANAKASAKADAREVREIIQPHNDPAEAMRQAIEANEALQKEKIRD